MSECDREASMTKETLVYWRLLHHGKEIQEFDLHNRKIFLSARKEEFFKINFFVKLILLF